MATRTPVTPLYALAGAGDLAVEKFRAVSEDVTARIAKLDQKALQATLQTQLSKRQAELAQRLEALVADARAAAPRLRELPAVAQAGLTTVLGQAEETYEDLAARGEEIVGRIRHQKATEEAVARTETTVSKAKATRTTAKKAAGGAARSAKSTTTSARKAAAAAGEAVAEAATKVGD